MGMGLGLGCGPLLCILAILLCLVGRGWAQCIVSTYPYNFTLTNNKKVNATQRLRIGMLGSFFGVDINATKAYAHYLNNRDDILPDTAIDIFQSATPTASDILVGAQYQIVGLHIQGFISGQTSVESRTAQLVAKIYRIPQISSMSLSAILSDKNEYPYFLRTIPDETTMISGIVALFRSFNWKRGVVIYTNDDYGSGYTRMISAALAHNISLNSISIPATAATAADVADSMASLKQMLKEQDYRVFIMYVTSSFADRTMRSAMNVSGLFGPQYVYILTSSLMTVYINNQVPLNNGAIGLYPSTMFSGEYKDFFNHWGSDPTNPYPRPASIITSSCYYMIDALLTYVTTFDRLLKSGISFANITNAFLLSHLLNSSFTGFTGEVSFTPNGDRIGNFNVYSIYNGVSNIAATYSAGADNITQLGAFKFYDGSEGVPRDSSFWCERCKYGTCVDNVGCVCFPDYSGASCDVHKSSSTWIAVVVVVPIAIIFVVVFAGVYLYRRKKYILMEEMKGKQRSTIDRSAINMTTRIGRGASGEVFKATYRGTEVAVKNIIATDADKTVVREFEMEVAIMCGLRHPNIILFMGSCYDPIAKSMMIVMEYMAKGSLHDVLHNQKIKMTYGMNLHLALQTAQGMNFLHQSSPPICHCDLKSHNILLDDKWNARISDFGLTKFSGNSIGNTVGTIYWTSPESLEGIEYTEKSDIYSFGIILWELFHRKDPFSGADPVAVAMEVIRGVRPPINPTIPAEIKDLILTCWHQDVNQRPSFQAIVSILRKLSADNPVVSLGQGTTLEAPSGLVYFVKMDIVGALAIMEEMPRQMCEATALLNGLARAHADTYGGYEASSDFNSFLIAFTTAEDAVNWCMATQLSLLQIKWPKQLLRLAQCAPVKSANGVLLWNGLHTEMTVVCGVPNCEISSSTGRMHYFGPVVEKVSKLQRGAEGAIYITAPVYDKINNTTLLYPFFIKPFGELSSPRDGSSPVYKVTIAELQERDAPDDVRSPIGANHHAVIVVNDEFTPLQPARPRGSAYGLEGIPWIAKMDEFSHVQHIGRGLLGDFYRANWKSIDVVIKTFVNQKLAEPDLLQFLASAASMTKMSHPNIVQFHSICLEPNNIAIICEYMPRRDLKTILSDNLIDLPMRRRLQFALNIASGMEYIASIDAEDIHIHDNLKSNNVLVDNNWVAKVADYGQGIIKELARTMTTVGNISWTAPELLQGDRATPSAAIYSFGIILWELYTRQTPYPKEHPVRIVSKILTGFRPVMPPDCPDAYKELYEQCVRSEPSERPSWVHIIKVLSSLQ